MLLFEKRRNVLLDYSQAGGREYGSAEEWIHQAEKASSRLRPTFVP